MKKFLILKSLIGAEQYDQNKILQLVQEGATLEEAEENVISEENFIDLESSDEIFQHIAVITAKNENEAYELYKKNSLKKYTTPFYYLKEQLSFLEIV